MKNTIGIRWSFFLKVGSLSFLGTFVLLLLYFWYWPSVSWIVNPVIWDLELRKGEGRYRIIGYYNGSRTGQWYSIGGVLLDTKTRELVKYPRVVLDLGQKGVWDSRHVKDPYALKIGPRYYLYYSGTTESSDYKIGLAYSWEGLRFNRAEESPILNRGEKGTWDDAGVSFPVVWIEEDLTWKMLYSGRDSHNQMGIGLAVSGDGVNWIKSGANPLLEDRRLVVGDKLGDAVYFGKEVNGKDEAWVGVLEEDDTIGSTKRILASDWSVTPRAVQYGTPCTMVATLFVDPSSDKPFIREKMRWANSPDCLNWEWGGQPFEDPDPASRRWDAVSAENFAWIRRYENVGK